jgi:hypothetical protein
MMDNTSTALPESPFSSESAMLQQVLDLLIGLIIDFSHAYSAISIGTKFCTHGTFASSITLNTDDLGTPFFLRKQ